MRIQGNELCSGFVCLELISAPSKHLCNQSAKLLVSFGSVRRQVRKNVIISMHVAGIPMSFLTVFLQNLT